LPVRTTILVIEDEPRLRSFLGDVLKGEGHEVFEAPDGARGMELAPAADLVLTDLRMPGTPAGLDLVRALRALEDPPEVVVMTAHGSVATAVEAMKAGALDFLEKPFSGPDEVRMVARRALERRALARDNERLRAAARRPGTDADPVVADPAMRAVLDRVARVAQTETTVLVLGESGSGKEVVARHLHRLRFPDDAPFVAINCASMSETLLESELFGHEKGAFTGAVERKPGLLEVASDGTLFLDEVGEMPPALQARLLRVLETRQFSRVGGIRVLHTNAMLVAATNTDLAAAVAAGRFRQDLYYRLEVFPVRVPPLRDRPADVEALARHFLLRYGSRGRPVPLRLSPAAEAMLRAYDWPGNVRELRNAIERAAILAEDGVIEPEDLGLPVRAAPPGDASGGRLAEMERQAIVQALRDSDGNRRQAARILGISLRTLQYRLKDYGLIEK
jgi:two-component system response regulator FlrC